MLERKNRWALELVIIVHNWLIKLHYLLTVDVHFVWVVRYKRLDVTCSCTCKLCLILQITLYLRMEATLKSAFLCSAVFFAFCATEVQCRTGWWARFVIFAFILYLTSVVFPNSATIITQGWLIWLLIYDCICHYSLRFVFSPTRYRLSGGKMRTKIYASGNHKWQKL